MAVSKTPKAGSSQSLSGQHDPEWFMKSHFPVLFPSHPAFTYLQSDFEAFLRKELTGDGAALLDDVKTLNDHDEASDSATIISALTTTADVRDALKEVRLNDAKPKEPEPSAAPDMDTDAPITATDNPFMKGLKEHNQPEKRDMSNKMFTENGDVAHRSTNSALVDLFSELEDVVSGSRLYDLLEAAWRVDPLAALKIIFNARSIHLGKSSRITTYRCFGWLATQHPLTLVNNLQWLSRPVIAKKAEKKTDDEDDMVMVEAEKDEDDPTRFDIKHGVAHGYWKDLLNILALSANKKLTVLSNPKEVLNVEKPTTKRRKINWNAEDAKHRRRDTRDNRHAEATTAFENEPTHRALHITVARLFAEELKADLVRLRSGDAGARRHITLCAKWAPSQKLFHDKHTFIVSSIAEIMHPQSEFPGATSREAYLRRAREAYRKDVASLRKALEVVERDITAKTFENIKYDRVPSVAMNNYASIFAEKDTARFEKYIDKVAEGKKQISGAVLLPSKLILAAREAAGVSYGYTPSKKRPAKGAAKVMIEEKMKGISAKVIDGQWKALVQRIKDSGTLETSIAVCDVSGSMLGPRFADGTCPMDSAIGLSLLVAEVTKAPFGNSFITFSATPKVQTIDPEKTLIQKYNEISSSQMGMNTDFVAVFEKLILPMALKNKLKQEDMVKQIFVFSDMQFDQADSNNERYSTAFERIEKNFKLHGYEMPKLIFWNLAGGRAGYTGHGDPVAPKPVTHDQNGTALVSGYSQGMLKVFLDSGSFEEPEEAVGVEEVGKQDEDGEGAVEVRKKVRMDPLLTVKKAIGHNAYSMLKVFD